MIFSKPPAWASATLSEQRETIERKKNYSLIMKTIPGQCQGCWHSAEAWHQWSWKRLGEWGWHGMWQVRGSPWKWECKQRETKKTHLHGWGADNGGQRLGQHSRVPGKDISKEKKTKKIKKNSHRGEAMSAVVLEEKLKSTWGNVETAAHAEVTWPKFNFSLRSNSKSIFHCSPAPHSYVTCQHTR